MKILLISGFAMIGCFMNLSCFSQASISGPTCVIEGTIYQYNIQGDWDSSATINICVTGGVISDSINVNACSTAEKPVPFVMVEWNTLGPVSIEMRSPATGDTTLNITVIQSLIPGVIDSATSFQSIGYDSLPTTITCSADIGGSCNPTYTDQWQQSVDQMAWVDISGATNQNLDFNGGLQQTTYFRREVVETTSGTIGYSGVATVVVSPPPTGYLPELNKYYPATAMLENQVMKSNN